MHRCIDRHLVDHHELAPDAIKLIVRQVKAQVRSAVEWAKNSPEPSMDELYTDVYTDHWGPYTGTKKPDMLKEGEDE